MAEKTTRAASRSCTLSPGGHHAEQVGLRVGEDVALAALDLFARIVTATLRGDGVGALHALAVDDRRAGRGVFFAALRRCSRSTVWMRSHRPLLVQRVRAACTVVRGGYSLGSMRHRQPVLRR